MRSQFANWRGVMWRILSKSARLYTAIHYVPRPQNASAYYLQLAAVSATRILVESCGESGWFICSGNGAGRQYQTLSFRTQSEPALSDAERNLLLGYTATNAAWYSSYVPLKSVILRSLSKCQM